MYCFLCRGKNKTLFCANHAMINEALFIFWNAGSKKNINRNLNKTQARKQTRFVTFAFVHVYGLMVFYVGKKIRPYFGQKKTYFIPYAKET